MRSMEGLKHRPYNLILGNLHTMKFFYRNADYKDKKVDLLGNNFHVMTNCVKEVDWDKGVHGLKLMKDLCSKLNEEKVGYNRDKIVEGGMKILGDNTNFSFMKWGHHSIFNKVDVKHGVKWGTRSSTFILVGADGKISMEEKFYDMKN